MEKSPLAAAREKHHFTQEEVAARVGVDATTVHRRERGKTKPYPIHIRGLCELFETTASRLGFEEEHEAATIGRPEDNKVTMFLANDPTMRLLALAFLPHKSHQDVQGALRQILQEDDTMSDITRRQALSRLATLPMLTLGLPAPSKSNPSDTLNQCAASIAACWELSRSSNEADIALAFDVVSAFVAPLATIVKESSRYRMEAAGLVAQAELLKTILAWHFAGLRETIDYARRAVSYSQETSDIPLQLSTLKCLAWSLYYDHNESAATQTMEQAILLLRQHQDALPPYTHSNMYSTLAVMQASHGESIDQVLRIAERGLSDAESPVYVDAPVPAYIRNAGIALSHERQYDSALKCFGQLIDTNTLQVRRSLPERTRVEILNAMALTSLKSPKRDLELTLHFWDAGIQGAKKLRSNLRYSEARAVFEIAEAIWPDEPRIEERRAAAMHW